MSILDEIKKQKVEGKFKVPESQDNSSLQSSIHQQVADLDTSLNTYGIVPYQTFSERTGKILDCQKELHRIFMKYRYPLLRPILELWDYGASLLGVKKPTIEEVYAREISLVRDLNRDLEKMLANCEKFVKDMEDFRKEVYKEAVESNKKLKELELKIREKSKTYNALKSQLDNLSPLGEKAFKIDQELENIENERDRLYLEYIRALDTISDNTVDIKTSRDFKKIFLLNYFTYQRMCDRVKRIERRLSHFIGPYIMMYGIQEVGKDVYSQVVAVSRFSRELHRLTLTRVSEGIRMLRSSMSEIYDTFYQDSFQALDQIQIENALLNQQFEERTKNNIRNLKLR